MLVFFTTTFLDIIMYLLNTYMIIIIITTILKFAGADPNNPLSHFLYILTDPPANWLSRKFPRLIAKTSNGYLDLSPLVIILMIGCLQIVVKNLKFYLM